ncbi:hypothetical protein HPB51_001332 [Rhipicephalus microplus]|uniref:Uncharacterized protein n=1 Tax=Rhipicephalus microplus TaxID=6941 RepID=A0A9J6EVV0_RHIMP|nr:hypothetical protein HPB51_001332 [Rhipicephalus microplus]
MSWCKKILADVEKATKEIEWTDWWEGEGPDGERTEAPDPTRVDSCLAHLILAKKSMQHRVSKQKFNEKLRKKIAKVHREIETHCSRLCKQEWEELCNTMNGNVSTGCTCKIWKHLLDPASTRLAVRTEMAKLRHKYKDDPEALTAEISEILLHRPRKPGRPPRDVAEVRQTGVYVTTKAGLRILTVSKIRVPSLWLEENGANSKLVSRL